MHGDVDGNLLELYEWLLQDGLHSVGPLEVGRDLCERLVALGLPICRAHVLVLVLHPLLHGRSYHWRPESGSYQQDHPHGLQHLPAWRHSVFRAIVEGELPELARFDLRRAEERARFPMFEELAAEGITEYVAIRIRYSDGSRHAMSFATASPEGFAEEDVALLARLERIMAARLEAALQRELREVLLATYLGADPAARVLAGSIRRGDAESIDAVIWLSDLRRFTRLSDTLPPELLVGLLSDYFETVVEAVRYYGGEVLKFIGDAVLAIFRDGEGTDVGCRRAANAARRAAARLDTLLESRRERGLPGFEMGIALHVGQVTYGNVGAPDRLDFTVIGSAVNLTARIETLCSRLDEPILTSATFARALNEPLPSRGTHEVKGLDEHIEVFALPRT